MSHESEQAPSPAQRQDEEGLGEQCGEIYQSQLNASSRNSNVRKQALARGFSEQKTGKTLAKKRALRNGRLDLDDDAPTQKFEQPALTTKQRGSFSAQCSSEHKEEDSLCQTMEVLPSHSPVKPPRKKNPSTLKSSVYQKEPKYKIASELTVPVLSQKKEQEDSRRESVKMGSELSSQLHLEPDSAATDPFLPRSSHYSSSKPQTLDPLNDSVPTPKTESQPVASDSFVLQAQSGA